MSEPTEVVGETHITIDPHDLPSGTCFGFDNPWGHDLNLMPVRSGMSIYDELRFLEKRSYNEKIKMWKRKQAAVVAEENRRKKRAEQRNLATLYGTGEIKSRVLRYLKRTKEPWSRSCDIWKAIHVPKTSVKGALKKLEKCGLIEIARKPGYTFVRLVAQTDPCRQLSTPIQSEQVLTPATVTDTPELIHEALCRQMSTPVQSESVPTSVAVTDTPEPTPEALCGQLSTPRAFESVPVPQAIADRPKTEQEALCRQSSTGDRIIEKLKGSGSWVSMEELEAVSGSTNVCKMISALRHRHGYEIVSQTFYRLNKFPHS